jgi:hypothetical protein
MDIDWFDDLSEENKAKLLKGMHERFRLCSSRCPCWSFEHNRYARSPRRDTKEEHERTMGGSHA